MRAARKREKAIRAREAIRRRGEALLEAEDALSDADAFGENRGVCAVDVATRAPALGFRTDPPRERATAGVDEPSLSFRRRNARTTPRRSGAGASRRGNPPRWRSRRSRTCRTRSSDGATRSDVERDTRDAEARGPRRADARLFRRRTQTTLKRRRTKRRRKRRRACLGVSRTAETRDIIRHGRLRTV